MRGRKPKPVETKLIGGNAGRRPLPKMDDLAKVCGEPLMPPGFDASLAAEWDAAVGDLREAGTLGRENGAAIEIYVRNLDRMRRAEAHVAEHGAVVPAPRTGVPMHNPYLAIANRAAEMVAKMAAELGLTPSSRGRVTKAEREREKDPAAGYFN